MLVHGVRIVVSFGRKPSFETLVVIPEADLLSTVIRDARPRFA